MNDPLDFDPLQFEDVAELIEVLPTPVAKTIDEREFRALDTIVDSALIQLHDRVVNGDIKRIPSLLGDDKYIDQRTPLNANTLVNVLTLTTDRRDAVRIRQKQIGASVDAKRRELVEALLATFDKPEVCIDAELVTYTVEEIGDGS